MKILLHTCCAPCASHCVLALREAGHEVTLFYSNANIAPHDEWRRRLDALQTLVRHYACPLIVDTPSHVEWLRQVAAGFEQEPERGARCERCFRYSLARSYNAAIEKGFDAFTTSLTVSPHKPSALIFDVGKALSETRFLAMDFKKQNGFKHSLELSAQLGLYRQSYCGCEFSASRSYVPCRSS
jgi:predicted adenine nucleotide alpha hydrolase (AANH) superfamily ATPase